jgi:hypothetical protein
MRATVIEQVMHVSWFMTEECWHHTSGAESAGWMVWMQFNTFFYGVMFVFGTLVARRITRDGG